MKIVRLVSFLFNCHLALSTANQRRRLTTVSEASAMSINGWWGGCGRLNKKCEGGFKEYDPVPIDPTGETCYINPLRGELGAVNWVAPLIGSDPESQDVYVYAVFFPQSMIDTYLPTNCTDTFACSCETIEPLRVGWKSNPNACGADAIACEHVAADFDAGSDCNAREYITFSDPEEGTQAYCSWSVSLTASSAASASYWMAAGIAVVSWIWML